MKKFIDLHGNEKIPGIKKLFKVMRLTCLLILVSVMSVLAGKTYSQTKLLNLNMDNATVKEVLGEIEKQSEFRFMYSGKFIDVNREVSVNVKNQKIETVLNLLFAKTNVGYKIKDRFIVLTTPELMDYGVEAVFQQLTVSGKVTDSSGQPLPGVSIVVKGTTQGTVTNADGEYTLTNISPDATLVFSFVGMITQEVVVGRQTIINITMQEDIIGIEEVVAVGYGTLRRNKISTSIVSLEPEEIKDQATTSMEHSLEGKIAGLVVTQQSGAPGSSAQLRIRGSGSIGAGDDPLFVIDGIPFQNVYSYTQSPLSFINPSDIESIDVLKDVSATSIYGSRGSNGVIIITTKSAKKGVTDFSLNIQSGVAHMMAQERLDMMNAEEFARWRKENRYERAAFYGEEITIDDIPEEYRNPEALGEGTDWYDVITRPAFQQNYNLNVSHGSENFTGFFSIGYKNEDGIVKETNFKRLSFRANMSYEPNDVIKVSLNLNPTIRWWGNRFGPYRESWFGLTEILTPVDGPYFDDVPWEQEEYFDGKYDYNIYSSDSFPAPNPLHALKTQKNNANSYNTYFQPSIQLTPLQGLVFKSQLNLSINQDFNDYFNPSIISPIYSLPPVQASGSYGSSKSFYWLSENTINYNKVFGNHSINLLGGYSIERSHSYWASISGTKYPSDDIPTLNAASELTGGTYESNWSMISYILRLNYDYKSKYLFTGAVRRDGSSRFGSNKKWGYFPSGSFGWNITKENFFPTTDWLTNIKWRVSYGMSGNNDIGNYTWIPTVSSNNYSFGGQLADGKRRSALENINLSWEKSREFNTGLDVTLFGGRLDFTIDYYTKNTKNMLWSVNIPTTSGFNSIMENIGMIRNRGLEFGIHTINISNNNFTWNTDFNISFNRNKVLDLGDVSEIRRGAGWQTYTLTTVGKPMAQFCGWKSLGILKNQEEVDKYPTIPGQLPGTPHYLDADGNGLIDGQDRVIIGDPHPAFRGGMSNNLNYKNWDLNISMSFAHDFDLYARFEEDVLNLDGVFNVLKEVEERWRSPEEPGNGRIAATFHQTAFDRQGNSDWVYNASYLKIQNFAIGYTLNKLNFVKDLRLFFSVQNPLLFTNYKYGNPDVNSGFNSSLIQGLDYHAYPLTRTFVLGVNMNF